MHSLWNLEVSTKSISVRPKPDIAKVRERECKRRRKTRTDLIQEALAAFLEPDAAETRGRGR